MNLRIYGKAIVNIYNEGKPYAEHTILAWCDNPALGAKKLLRAHNLNEDRHYKASARAYAELETLPGWEWDQTLDWWDDDNPERPRKEAEAMTTQTHTCQRCTWTWTPRPSTQQHGTKPAACPRCGSRKWEVPRDTSAAIRGREEGGR